MALKYNRLPSRFPVGTKFVIEGRAGAGGNIYARHLEFPDGTTFQLPSRGATAPAEKTATAPALASTRATKTETRPRGAGLPGDRLIAS
jgi:hypothetical protein